MHMAAHYTKPGTTDLIEGRVYSRYPAGHIWCDLWTRCELVVYNATTGTCKIQNIIDKHSRYISASELTTWHMVGGW